MKKKAHEKGFKLVREMVHQWKPVRWAGYDGDKPALFPDDTDYEIAKSMIEDELDDYIHSIVKRLDKVKTETDLAFLLHKTFVSLDDTVDFEKTKEKAKDLYSSLK